MDRMDNKESFVCTFVDIVKESERMCRQLYTRTVYYCTICREVAGSAIKTLEGTMRLLQTILANSDMERSGCDDMTDGASGGINTNNYKSGTEEVLRDLLFKTRCLKSDVDNMDQAAQLMDDVRLLDTSLRVSTGEVQGNCMDCDHVVDSRKRMEALVRRGMQYDETKQRSVSELDQLVLKKTERRLKATAMEGSNVVAGVVSMLKKNGVQNPGTVPTETEDMLCPRTAPPDNDDIQPCRMRPGAGSDC